MFYSCTINFRKKFLATCDARISCQTGLLDISFGNMVANLSIYSPNLHSSHVYINYLNHLNASSFVVSNLEKEHVD